ncbi:MAG: metallophosphoesterase, partial [Methylotetracoccus sp.]|nr:metallophosphoesterase [Methylotetracoccus sp.]
MTIRILCLGDIHLGRISTKLPEGLARSALAAPRTTLLRSAAAGCEHKVDLAVFVGDVVDQSDAYFEGHSTLIETVTAFARAGIPSYAVAGNHDYEALR